MPLVPLILSVLAGLAAGSAATAFAETGSLSVWARRRRSTCSHCRRPLRPLELIPLLSFLLLRGRCRSCHQPIPPWHLLTELSGAAALGGVVALRREAPPLELALVFLLVLLLLALAVTDLRLLLLPDPLVSGVALVGLVRSIVRQDPGLGASLGGGALGLAALGLLALIPWRSRFSPSPSSRPPSAIGLGDIKLAGALGLTLGVFGITTALTLAFLAGGIVGAVLLLSRRASLGTRVPFGPFLAAATYALLVLPDLPRFFLRVLVPE